MVVVTGEGSHTPEGPLVSFEVGFGLHQGIQGASKVQGPRNELLQWCYLVPIGANLAWRFSNELPWFEDLPMENKIARKIFAMVRTVELLVTQILLKHHVATLDHCECVCLVGAFSRVDK